MGTCGGAPSSFLCVAAAPGDRGRRDYPAQGRVETSPQRPGRALVRHLDVVPPRRIHGFCFGLHRAQIHANFALQVVSHEGPY